MNAAVYDSRPCELGEGPLWHPERRQLFWFDINAKKMLSRKGSEQLNWDFEEEVSAAAWIDTDNLLIASASGLWRFCLTDGTRELLAPLERTNTVTRSNDGRADPWGGFWIGTMGRQTETGAGAIYRLYQGQLRKLFDGLTIPNAICFDPKRGRAFFTDTPTGKIMSVALDRVGWPDARPRIFVDLTREGLAPDGAVTDQDGTIWVAQWGAGRVAAYDRRGDFLHAVEVPAQQPSCPAFGGTKMRTLFVTTARESLTSDSALENGMTFAVDDVAQGLPEPRVFV